MRDDRMWRAAPATTVCARTPAPPASAPVDWQRVVANRAPTIARFPVPIVARQPEPHADAKRDKGKEKEGDGSARLEQALAAKRAATGSEFGAKAKGESDSAADDDPLAYSFESSDTEGEVDEASVSDPDDDYRSPASFNDDDAADRELAASLGVEYPEAAAPAPPAPGVLQHGTGNVRAMASAYQQMLAGLNARPPLRVPALSSAQPAAQPAPTPAAQAPASTPAAAPAPTTEDDDAFAKRQAARLAVLQGQAEASRLKDQEKAQQAKERRARMKQLRKQRRKRKSATLEALDEEATLAPDERKEARKAREGGLKKAKGLDKRQVRAEAKAWRHKHHARRDEAARQDRADTRWGSHGLEGEERRAYLRELWSKQDGASPEPTHAASGAGRSEQTFATKELAHGAGSRVRNEHNESRNLIDEFMPGFHKQLIGSGELAERERATMKRTDDRHGDLMRRRKGTPELRAKFKVDPGRSPDIRAGLKRLWGWTDEDVERWFEVQTWDAGDRDGVFKVDYKPGADEAQRDRHAIRPGATMQLGDQPFDTSEHLSKFAGQGWAIFVMGGDGRIYAGQHRVGLFHHSSFLGGGAVAAAGEMQVSAGKLTGLTAKSGHYMPTMTENQQLVQRLAEAGTQLDDVNITVWIQHDEAWDHEGKAMEFGAKPAAPVQYIHVFKAAELLETTDWRKLTNVQPPGRGQ